MRREHAVALADALAGPWNPPWNADARISAPTSSGRVDRGDVDRPASG
jgi:hypothetical protein